MLYLQNVHIAKLEKNITLLISEWMLLAQEMSNASTINQCEMSILLEERTFWRNVLLRLIDIVVFVFERNLAFRVSEENLGSPHNENLLGRLSLRRKGILF